MSPNSQAPELAPDMAPEQAIKRARAGIFGAIACTAIFALTLGLTYPLMSFVLKTQGIGDTAIGISSAMTPLGILLAAPRYPRLLQRVASWKIASLCLLLSGLLLGLLGLTQHFAVILVLRFLLGVVDVGVFVVSETWINQLAQDKSRGRIVGFYAMALSTGFGGGPLILALTGPDGYLPFAIGVGFCLLAVLVVLAIRNLTPDVTKEESTSALAFLRMAPTLLLAIAVFAFWESGVLGLFPVYGLDAGLSAGFISVALSVCILGNTFLQVPIGWLSDRTSRRGVLIGCAVMASAGAVLLPLVIGVAWLLLPLLFVWGATVGGLYTMAMTELGDRFSGADLVAGNVAFAFAFGVGGIIGGPSIGAAMTVIGPGGFSGVLALVLALTAGFALWRTWAARG